MPATMITAAIVAALVAVTLVVFAGGGDSAETTAAPRDVDTAGKACEAATGTGCVQAARDAVEAYSAPPPSQPAPAPTP